MASQTRPPVPDRADQAHRADRAEPSACCRSITAGVMELEDAQRLARALKALGDPTRIRLLSIIAAQPGAQACVCELTEPVGLSQPTVSHHMRQLVGAGLVVREQRGRWAYYTLVPQMLTRLSVALDPRT